MKKQLIVGALASTFVLGGIGATVEASPQEKPNAVKGEYGYDVKKKLEKHLKDQENILEADVLKKFKSEFAEVDGNTIHYKVYQGKKNAKKTYVVVHGATATLETTKVYAAALAKENPDARILLVDLPLRGQSTSATFTTADISIEKYADIMKQFIEQKRADGIIKGKLNYSGWSMGGSIGMKLELAGAPIDELVLINTSPVWESIEGLKAVFGIESFTPEIISMMTAGNYTEEVAQGMDFDTYMDKFHGSPVVGAADFNALSVDAYDVREQLNQIDAKTLIFSGTLDDLAEPRMQTLMDGQIPKSELVMYENGHDMFMKPEIAQEMAKEITQYFEKKNGKKEGHK